MCSSDFLYRNLHRDQNCEVILFSDNLSVGPIRHITPANRCDFFQSSSAWHTRLDFKRFTHWIFNQYSHLNILEYEICEDDIVFIWTSNLIHEACNALYYVGDLLREKNVNIIIVKNNFSRCSTEKGLWIALENKFSQFVTEIINLFSDEEFNMESMIWTKHDDINELYKISNSNDIAVFFPTTQDKEHLKIYWEELKTQDTGDRKWKNDILKNV